jgi:tetratricopeptide (TPR) repeat protein
MTIRLAAILLLSLVLLASDQARAQDAPTCGLGEAQLRVGRLDAAERTFDAVLQREGQLSECVRAGLAEVDERRLRRAVTQARLLQLRGENRQAERELAGAVAAAFGSRRAQRSRLIAVLSALEKSGDRDVAVLVLSAVRAGKPDRDLSLPRELAAVEKAATPAAEPTKAEMAEEKIALAEKLDDAGFRDEAREQVQGAIELDPDVEVPDQLLEPTRRPPWWEKFLGAVGPWFRFVVEALLILLVLALVVRFLSTTTRRSLGTGKFEAADDNVGHDIEVAVRGHLNSLIEDFGGPQLGKVDASGDAFSVPASLSQEYPQVALVTGLLTFIDRLFSRGWVVDGRLLERDTASGAGLAMTVSRRGKVRRQVVLRERDFGTPAAESDVAVARESLAIAAAVWLMYEQASRSVLGLGRKSPRLLGTTSWRSYALFAIAQATRRRDDEARSRRADLDALAQDPRNAGARFNVATGFLKLSAEKPTQFGGFASFARDELVSLQGEVELESGYDKRPLWYRVTYQRVVATFQTAAPLPAAEAEAFRLAWTILHRQGGFARPWRPSRSRELRKFLSSAWPAAAVVLASAQVLSGGGGAVPPTPPSYGELRRGLRAGDISPGALVASVEADLESLRPDALYNLACYYARVGDVNKAIERLRPALWRDATLQAWAKQDPALVNVRADVGDALEPPA